jgi:hypothetical protein
MGNPTQGGSGPGSDPDEVYGSDTASPEKSQGRKSTDVASTRNVNPNTAKPADVGADRVDSGPDDLQRQAGGYEVIQAGKTKVPGEDVIAQGENPEGREGYDRTYGDVRASVNHIVDGAEMPPVEHTNDLIEQV